MLASNVGQTNQAIMIIFSIGNHYDFHQIQYGRLESIWQSVQPQTKKLLAQFQVGFQMFVNYILCFKLYDEIFFCKLGINLLWILGERWSSISAHPVYMNYVFLIQILKYTLGKLNY